MKNLDAAGAIDLLDPSDPQARACDQCGAQGGEPCREHCTALPGMAALVSDVEQILGCEAGRIAVVVASDLRNAKVPGNPTATTTGGNNVAVVLTYPSGRDWIVAAVEVWGSGPVFYIGQYPDIADQDGPVVEVEIHDRVSAERAIIDMAARCEAHRG